MSRKIADLLIKIGADSYEFQQKTKQVEKGLDGISKKLTDVGKNLSLKLTAPLVALGAVSVNLADTQAKAEAKVQQAIKSTSGAAKLSFEQLKAFASELQGKTVFGDEDILNNATAQLLTFTNIAGENFKRTQTVALDLSTVLDGDLKSASIQLGNALNDPVKNLSALSRSGIQFTKEQTEVIKKLAETGQLAQAQAVILDELERQYGGQAEAVAKVGAGSLQQLKNSWGDFMEQLGAAILPGLNKLAGVLQGVVGWLQSLSPTTKTVIVAVAGVAAALGPILLTLGGIVKILPLLKAGMVALMSPMSALIGLAAMLAAGLYSAFNSYKELQNIEATLSDGRKQYGVELVASGRWKVGDLEYLEGMVAEAQKRLEGGNLLAGDWLSENNTPHHNYQNFESFNRHTVETYSAVIAELRKKKEMEEAAAVTAKEMMEDAKEQAEKLAKSITAVAGVSAGDVAKNSAIVGIEPPTAKVEVKAPEMKSIISQIRPAIDFIAEQYSQIWGKIYEMFNWLDSSSEKFDELASKTFEAVEGYTDRLVKRGWNFSNALAHVSETMASTIAAMDSTVSRALSDMVASSMEMVGQMIGGAGLGLEDFLGLILSQMASFLKQLGTQLIEFGTMMLMFKGALAGLLANPWLAIGVGAAMVGAAGALTAILNKNAEASIPKLATGGLAFGATYAMVGDNPNARIDPEVIAPLSKLKGMMGAGGGGAQNIQIALSGELRAKGRDLAYVLSKENFKLSLLGG